MLRHLNSYNACVPQKRLPFQEIDFLAPQTYHDGEQEGFKRFGISWSQFVLSLSYQRLHVERSAILEALTRLKLDAREGQGIRQADACEMLNYRSGKQTSRLTQVCVDAGLS